MNEGARIDNIMRRRLLAALTASTGAAASPQVLAQPPATTALQPQSQGYRVTSHVRDYYASTRLRKV